MFEFWYTLIFVVVGGIFMFGAARNFVRRKLRFVDGVFNPLVPWAAGAAAALAGAVLAGILPFIGAGAGVTVGIITGFGVASGVKAIKAGDSQP